MNDRGVIRNRQAATQVRDFSGLQFGTITPTDLDGLIEYHNRGFILIETKYGEAELPFGQRLAIERLVDDLHKPALGIVASHDSEGDIDVASSTVREVRFNRRWQSIDTAQTVRQLCDRFICYLDDSSTATR